MKVALFIPCYIDQFYPGVGIATLTLLEKLGLDVAYPAQQTCCGQPMANSGFEHLTGACNDHFVRNFSGYDYVVAPSGSCVLHIRDHLHATTPGTDAEHIRETTFELTQFLTDIVKVQSLHARFAHRVGLHQSCHGQRGLKLSQMSELMAPYYSRPRDLLRMVEGLELIDLDRPDECCGFGGTFCVAEEAVSVKMGLDRVYDHEQHHADYITANDMSCLMHLEGILKRKGSRTQVIHIAEILNAQG